MLNLTAAELGWGGLLLALLYLALRTAVRSGVERAVERKFRQWEVRFTALHERRLGVMEEVQDRLVALNRALEAASGIQWDMTDPEGLRHLQAATDAGNEAHRYVQSRLFYLPKNLGDKLLELLQEMKKAHVGLAMWAERRAGGGATGTRVDPDEERLYRSFGQEGREAIRKKLPPLIAEVENEFRRIVEGEDLDS